MIFNQLLPLHASAVPVGHSAVLSSSQVCLQAGGCCELVNKLAVEHTRICGASQKHAQYSIDAHMD